MMFTGMTLSAKNRRYSRDPRMRRIAPEWTPADPQLHPNAVRPEDDGARMTVVDRAAPISKPKAVVSDLLDLFGWETADMGCAEAARAIEPLCMLSLIPCFSRNEWGHAFKLLRRD